MPMRIAPFAYSSGISAADPLDQYLFRFRRALWGLPASEREQFVRLLRSDLLEEADCLGVQNASDMEAILARHDPPDSLARAIQAQQFRKALSWALAAAIPALAVFLWVFATPFLHVSSEEPFYYLKPWALEALKVFLIVYGQFLVRSLWAHRSEWQRLCIGTLFAFGGWSLLSFIQLGTADLMFVLPWAFVGFNIERMIHRKHWWLCILDALVFAVVLFLFNHGCNLIPAAPAMLPNGLYRAVLARPTINFPMVEMFSAIGIQAVLWAASQALFILRKRWALKAF